MKLEYTRADLIDCEQDAYKRGYNEGYKKAQIDTYKKITKDLKDINKTLKSR